MRGGRAVCSERMALCELLHVRRGCAFVGACDGLHCDVVMPEAHLQHGTGDVTASLGPPGITSMACAPALQQCVHLTARASQLQSHVQQVVRHQPPAWLLWWCRCGHHLLLAHAKAVQLYRQKYQAAQGGRISMALSGHWGRPFNATSPEGEREGSSRRGQERAAGGRDGAPCAVWVQLATPICPGRS